MGIEVSSTRANDNKSKMKSTAAQKVLPRKSVSKRADRSTKKAKTVIKQNRTGKMDNNQKNGSTGGKANLSGVQKRVLRVTRGTKAKLMSMNKKERKEHIARLKKKKRPYFDEAEHAKQLWETIRRFLFFGGGLHSCLTNIRNGSIYIMKGFLI